MCGYKATYDENGNFVRARTEDNFIEKHDELKDRYGVKELNILPSPLTLAEIKQELINSEIAEIRMDNLVDAIRSGDQSAKDAARLEKKKPFREHEGKIDIGITDQAIEYYMVRAELIRQQLERAGELDKLQDERINEIDPKLFAVRKEAVIAALEAKHGGAFSIKTQVPNNEIVSAGGLHKSPAEAKLVNNLGNGR